MEIATGADRDYFPWVVGALITATTVIAAAIALFNPAVHPTPLQAPAAAMASSSLMPLAAPLSAVAIPSSAVTPPSSAAAAPKLDAPAQTTDPGAVIAPQPAGEPTTRIWECKVSGQRIFSDAPCGTGGVARDISAPNRMEAVPVMYGYPRSYGPPDTMPEPSGFTPENSVLTGTTVFAGPYAVRGPGRFRHHHGPGTSAHPPAAAHH